MKKASVRMYKAGDEQGIVRLFGGTFGRTMTIDEWRWKYLGQNAGEVCSALLLNEEGAVVGHYGGIPLRMVCHGSEMTGVVSCDVMIEPAYRGIWVLRRLHHHFVDAHVKRGVRMLYGFPTEGTLLLPAERIGMYERIEIVYEHSKEVAPEVSSVPRLYRLDPLSFEDGRIDILWAAVRGSIGIAVERDGLFMRWRFRDHPVNRYEIWGLRRRWGSALLGIVVIKQEGADDLRIMDLVFREGYFPRLIQEVEHLARRRGKRKLKLWFPARMIAVLSGLGFASQPSGATLPRSTNAATLGKEEIASYFYYTCGDTDFL